MYILHKHLLFIIYNHLTDYLKNKKNNRTKINKLIVSFHITFYTTELKKKIR